MISKGVMSPTNKIKYQAKLEEIEAKELKVFGILLAEHIEPASRAFSLIGLENLMKGDPVLIFDILKKSFNNTKTVAGLFGAIEKFNDHPGPPGGGAEILGFLNRNYAMISNLTMTHDNEFLRTKRFPRSTYSAAHHRASYSSQARGAAGSNTATTRDKISVRGGG